jgi:alkyl hydroperoxide reductase subunit AhpF
MIKKYLFALRNIQKSNKFKFCTSTAENEKMEYDYLIVGGGPAG